MSQVKLYLSGHNAVVLECNECGVWRAFEVYAEGIDFEVLTAWEDLHVHFVPQPGDNGYMSSDDYFKASASTSNTIDPPTVVAHIEKALANK